MSEMARFHLDQSFGAASGGNALLLVSHDSDAAETKLPGHPVLCRILPIHESSRSRHPSLAAAPARCRFCRASHRMALPKGGPRDLEQVAVASLHSSDLLFVFSGVLSRLKC